MSEYSQFLDKDNVLSMLTEANSALRGYNFDLENDSDWRSMIQEEGARSVYLNTLKEGLTYDDAKTFDILAENIVNMSALNESNTTAGFIPQAKMVMPLFRFMWPRLVMKEFVNVVPMNAPEIVRYFFRPVAVDAGGSKITLPSYNAIGLGLPVGTVNAPFMVDVPDSKNIIEAAGITGSDKSQATVQRGVIFVNWEGLAEDGSTAISGDIYNGSVDEEGKFSFTIEIDPVAHTKDIVSGHIDFESGDLVVSSLNSTKTDVAKITKIGLIASVSTAEYNKAMEITFDPKKIRFMTEDIELSAQWSIQWEQDQRSRMGLDVQAEFISVFGNQIQLNIDSLMLNDIMFNVQKYNAPNIRTFSKAPSRSAFAGTIKLWAEELLIKIEECSAQIYNDTNLMPATHIVVNPKDLVWLKMLNDFDFKGFYDKNGVMGSSPVVGSFQNSYTVLSSPIVPSSSMLIGAKPAQDSFANYMFCPYVPILLNPYPLGQRPAMTVLSRFSRKMLRPEGYGIIQLINNND